MMTNTGTRSRPPQAWGEVSTRAAGAGSSLTYETVALFPVGAFRSICFIDPS